MRAVLLISLVLVLFALIFPVAACWEPGEAAPPPDDGPAGDSEDPPYYTDSGQTSDYDLVTTVTLLDGDELRELTVADYLVGSLAAEMPVSFNTEALRAQAVALRTYLVRKARLGSSAHPEADICSDSSCCAAWKSPETLRERWGSDYDANMAVIRSAVESTGGLCLEYGGEPALAVFHSSSAGRTESSGDVWNAELPYLVSVDSPESDETVPNYTVSVTVSAQEFAETVKGRFPGADLSGDVSEWITDVQRTGSGRLASVTIGGETVSGAELRSMFGLRSTAVEFTEVGGEVTMTATGYGHGVGMSQYGANVMAAQGASFTEILENYFPGTDLVVYS